jgi:hypothetical protein
MSDVPSRLRDYPLIRVCRPNCRSHNDCSSPGKRPNKAVDNNVPYLEIKRWLNQGGNYGVVAREANDLVIFDSDSSRFEKILKNRLPRTFTVRSGGGGKHYYYRSPEISTNRDWKEPGGSIRSTSWHCVGPGSTHADTENQYRVIRDQAIQPVPEGAVAKLISQFDGFKSKSVKTGGGGRSGGGGGGSSRSEKASDLQIEPTKETLKALGFINSDSRRSQVARVLDHHHPPRHIRVWAGGFLHSVCGLTQRQIERLLKERAGWATDNDRITTEVRSLVRESITNSRASESVNLDRYLSGPGDMEAEASESRKTESGEVSAGPQGGDNMSETDFDYTSKESLTVYNADSPDNAEDGDRVIRAEVTNMSGTDEDDEPVDTDFVSITKGSLRENGDFGVSPEFPRQSKSVGSADPEDLRLIADALEQLADDLE